MQRLHWAGNLKKEKLQIKSVSNTLLGISNIVAIYIVGVRAM